MKLQLESYQREMRDFLTGHPRAYCCVGMGLGKTAATLAALQDLFADGAIRSALIIAPLRVARVTWPNELSKWDDFGWMEVEHLCGNAPSGKAQIYLINYERIDKLGNLDFADAIVFDEVTRAKGHASKRIKRFSKLLRERHWRWGLTGTPRPNSLMDLFAQIRLIDNGDRLGKNFVHFKEKYFYPTDYMRYNWEPKLNSEREIYDSIQDITLSLRASDHLQLPDTSIEDLKATISDEAWKIYRKVEKEFLAVVKGHEIAAVNAAVMVGKLLQISSGAVYDDQKRPVVFDKRKIEILRHLQREVNEPLLVGCNYVHEIERICAEIPGAVNGSQIKGDIEAEWNSGKISMLVAHPASLGHGLNLQKGGRTVVWYALPWSRELYDQFNARVIRKGQGEQTMIFRIITHDTIDEAVALVLERRGREQDTMMEIMDTFRRMRSIE